jgi:hypothetical protein
MPRSTRALPCLSLDALQIQPPERWRECPAEPSDLSAPDKTSPHPRRCLIRFPANGFVLVPQMHKRDSGEAIGEVGQAFRAKSAQSDLIEAVVRSHKQSRIQSPAAKQCKAITVSIALLNQWLAREFRPAVQGQQALGATRALMPIAMKRNRGAFPLHRAHFLPEILIDRCCSQIVVLTIRNHGQDRANSKLPNEVSHVRPVLRAHRGAKVVDSKQVLRRPWKSLHLSRLSRFFLAASRVRDRRSLITQPQP